jgi:vWA-MoxR associated protein C-terminal domain/Effector-associated domain 1
MNTKVWKLNGPQVESLRLALQSAFRKKSELKRMVREKLDKNLDEIGEGNLTNTISELIDWAESEYRINQLVISAAYEKPGNPLIREFCETNIDELIEFNDSLLSATAFTNLFAILQTIDFLILWEIGKTIFPKTIARDRSQLIQKLEQAELSIWFKCFILLQLLVEVFPVFEQQPSILVFVSALSKETMLNDAVKQILREWLVNVDPNFNSQTGNLAQPHSDSSQPIRGGLQVYLMIMVNSEKSKLRATASLMCIAPTGMKKEISVHLNPESNERGILTTTKKLPQIVAQFIQHSISIELVHPENTMGCDYYALTIELFLPIRYLCEPIDQWEIKDDFGNPVSLGSKYRLVVRSYDRVIRPGLRNAFAEAWYWKKDWLEQNPEPTSLNDQICHLTEIDCLRMGTLREALKEKIGIKITCPLPESETEMLKFLQAMLESGVSMGTWTRSREQLTSHSEVEINQFWSSDLILNPGEFLERVRSMRASAFDEQESPEQHWGGHLTVLWDDLDRMPVLEPFKGG